MRREGRLAAVLPMARRFGALVSTANWHSEIFGPVTLDARAAADLGTAVMDQRVHRVDLAFLDSDLPELGELRAAAIAAGHRTLTRAVARAPYVPVEGDWESYEGRLKGKLRQNVRRSRRRLEELGELTVEVSDGSERLDDLLVEGFRLEGSGWKEERGTAIISSSRTTQFYRDVAHWAARRGWLRLYFLRLGGRGLAFDMALRAGGVHYLLKGGFDPAYRRFGPGRLLILESLRSAFEDRLSSYEFLGTEEEYKATLTDLARERLRFQAFPATPAGAASFRAWAHGRPLAKRAIEAARAR